MPSNKKDNSVPSACLLPHLDNSTSTYLQLLPSPPPFYFADTHLWRVFKITCFDIFLLRFLAAKLLHPAYDENF